MAQVPVLIDSSLKIFDAPPLYESFVETRDIVIRPVDGWQAGNTIDFVLPKYESMLYESDSFQIHMTTSIVNEDGSAPDEAKQSYAPANGVGFSAFSYATVQIGNDFICGDNKYDVYKNYLEYLLGHSKEAKETWMKYSLIYQEDEAGMFDDKTVISKVRTIPLNNVGETSKKEDNKKKKEEEVLPQRDEPSDADLISNAAFNWKYELYSFSSKVKTVAKLQYPLAQSKKMLPPGINMKVSLKKNDDKWIIICDPADTAMKLKIDDIYMTARLRVPTPQIFEQITKQLIANDGFARYPFLRSSISGPHHLVKNQTEFQFTAFKDVPPSAAFVFCVEAEACKGSFSKNPFRMTNPLYKQLALEVEGDTFPTNGYNFGNTFSHDPLAAQCKQVYLDLYRVLQQQYGGSNCGLSYDSFLAGSTIIGFQLNGKLLRYIFIYT